MSPNSYVEIPNSRAFSQPTSGRGLRVEAWMKPDSLVLRGVTNDPYVYWLGKNDQQSEWGFRMYSRESSRPNRISAYIRNAEGGLGAGAYFQDRLGPGEWMHIVACYDPGDGNSPGAGVSIYKNGELRGSPASQRGARYGALDEVAIYPRVLRSAEILDNYRNGVR